jgi:hypothetical protein
MIFVNYFIHFILGGLQEADHSEKEGSPACDLTAAVKTEQQEAEEEEDEEGRPLASPSSAASSVVVMNVGDLDMAVDVEEQDNSDFSAIFPHTHSLPLLPGQYVNISGTCV